MINKGETSLFNSSIKDAVTAIRNWNQRLIVH
jgi:hypothetical protein